MRETEDLINEKGVQYLRQDSCEQPKIQGRKRSPEDIYSSSHGVIMLHS